MRLVSHFFFVVFTEVIVKALETAFPAVSVCESTFTRGSTIDLYRASTCATHYHGVEIVVIVSSTPIWIKGIYITVVPISVSQNFSIRADIGVFTLFDIFDRLPTLL